MLLLYVPRGTFIEKIMQKTIKITLKGKVQGVFFRQFVKDSTDRLEIAGTVENLADGSVEVFATGEEGDLDKLVGYLEAGPPPAEVESVEREDLGEVEEFDGFQVLR
ncbi:acylphosphatase [Patescibacteria group bacterium]|nr:MAG: acylphosphatase [Patescibacteria group bacterium]